MLQLENIRAGYGTVEVLRGIDLIVPDGAVVALLGPNGAGKTTLLRVIAGLLPATAGSVRVGGAPVPSSPYARSTAGVCLIPEGRGIFPRLTVAENIAMFVNGRDTEGAVERAAEVFPKLGTRRRQLAGTLSGGEQQMLACVRALLHAPQIVLADELSCGLAPVIVDEILAAIDILRRQGVSLLIVEQYVSRVLEFADYVFVLNKGSVVFRGRAADCSSSALFEQYVGAVQ